jgi:hypothetical protein
MTATDLQPRVEKPGGPVVTLQERPYVASTSPAERWPWVVAAVAAGVACLVLMSFLALGWHLGTRADTLSAPRNPSHLLALVEGIQNLLVLGIAVVLGVGAMRRTAAAVRLAARHQADADLQRAAAERHQEAASRNLALAEARTRQLAGVQAVLDEVVAHADHRSRDNSRFVTDLEACDVPADPADPHQYRHLLVRSDTFSRVDPELAQLAHRARTLLQELRGSDQQA